ncbi:hypothetical protein PFISCL1PPCAC_26652, partial [Pristionchus fissidentatus]
QSDIFEEQDVTLSGYEADESMLILERTSKGSRNISRRSTKTETKKRRIYEWLERCVSEASCSFESVREPSRNKRRAACYRQQ